MDIRKKILVFVCLAVLSAAGVAAQQGFVINTDGSVSVNGRLKTVTDPVADQDAATKNYVNKVALSGILEEVIHTAPAPFISSYRKFADGTLEMWGWGYVDWTGAVNRVNTSFTLPVAFINSQYNISLTYGMTLTGSTPVYVTGVNDPAFIFFGGHAGGVSTVTVYAFSPMGNPPTSQHSLFHYRLIGKWKT